MNHPTWSFTVDQQGSRTNGSPADPALISSFGDSMTFGDEVNDSETWQFYLSGLTDTRVLNYGVGGYGLDQALLKLRREFDNGLATPFVVLSMGPDVTRLLSTYRAFYSINTGIPLGFKPMLLEATNGYRWLPNPLAKLDSRADIEAAFAAAKVHDFWYQARQLHDVFPYTVSTLRFTLMLAGWLDIPRQNQWGNARAVGRLRYVIDEFVAMVSARGLTPVFMFIPIVADLHDKARGKRPESRQFLDPIRARYATTRLLVVDVLERDFETEKFTVRRYDGHPSAYGNQQVAAALYAALLPHLEIHAASVAESRVSEK